MGIPEAMAFLINSFCAFSIRSKSSGGNTLCAQTELSNPFGYLRLSPFQSQVEQEAW